MYLDSIAHFLWKIEHAIYCITNCKIELPYHKAYYAERKRKYNRYLEIQNMSFL